MGTTNAVLNLPSQPMIPSVLDPKFGSAMPPFASLRAFEAFGRLGGVRRAAADLGVDHAVISRHLRALESWSGTSLIDRDKGPGCLTPLGAGYHAQITAALAMMANATAELVHRHDDNRLVLWCVPGLAMRWLMPRIGNFTALDDSIEMEIRPCDQSPDFLNFEADVDIRYAGCWATEEQDPRLMTMEIAAPRVFPVASPELAAELGEVTPADLRFARLLHEENDEQWRAWFAVQGLDVDARLSGPRLWHAHLAIDAARSGNGVALMNPLLAADDLEKGRLVELCRPRCPQEEVVLGSYRLTARRDRWRQPLLVRLRHWLQREIGGTVISIS